MTARNAVARFETNLCKKFASQLEGFDESQLRQLEALRELFEYLDEISSDEEISVEAPKRNRAARYVFGGESYIRHYLTIILYFSSARLAVVWEVLSRHPGQRDRCKKILKSYKRILPKSVHQKRGGVQNRAQSRKSFRKKVSAMKMKSRKKQLKMI